MAVMEHILNTFAKITASSEDPHGNAQIMGLVCIFIKI